MVRIYKENQVLSVNESEVQYYKGQGYKIVGEKETSEKGVSSSAYNKLMEDKTNLETELAEAKSTVDTKEQEITVLQAEKDALVQTNQTLDEDKQQLEKDLAEANKKIAELEKGSKGDK